MKKNVYISSIIVVIIVAFGVSLGVLLYSWIDKESIEKIEGVKFTLNDVKNEFLKSEYAIDNKCKGNISDNNIVIKCKKEKYVFKVKGDFLEVSTNKEGLELVSYVIEEIEHLLGSDETYIKTLEVYFTGKIYLKNIFMSKNNDKYDIKVSLVNLIDIYENKDVIDYKEKIEVSKSNYEINIGDYVVSGVNFASDKESLIYVIAGTLYNQDKRYNKKIKVVYYDNYDNVVEVNEVLMDDFDKYNSYLNFSIVSNIKDVNSFNKISKYTLSIE